MQFHPLANIFPLIEGAEFEQLVADIKAHGVREPVSIYEGMIIDGRNRYRASTAAGVDCPMRTFDGADPVAFVVSMNLKRRHLDESQRAMVAAKLANFEHGGDRTKSPIGDLKQQQAADMLNVGKRTVERAREVIDDGAPELIAAVEKGEASVSAAADLATLPKEEQTEIVARGAKEILEAAKKIRAQRLRGTLGTGDNEWYTPALYIDMARDVLGEFHLDPASSPKAQEVVQAANYFTAEDDGLTKAWHGHVWLNPPYAQPAITNFVMKLVTEFESGKVDQAILLTHNYTDTEWFHAAAKACQSICFPRGRIKFESPDGEKASPTQGQAFFYFGHNVEKFAKTFGSIGVVLTHGALELIE